MYVWKKDQRGEKIRSSSRAIERQDEDAEDTEEEKEEKYKRP